jgi:hypothetical protein
MELKALTLTEVAETVKESIPRASVPRVSEVLSGRRNDPEILAALRQAIHRAPQPREVVA